MYRVPGNAQLHRRDWRLNSREKHNVEDVKKETVGLAVFIDIISISATVREKYANLHLYCKCIVHEKRGIFESKEMSAFQVG